MILNSKGFVVAGAFVAGAFGLASCADVMYPPVKWESGAIPAAQGKVVEKDGKRMQIRYPSGGFARDKNDYSKYRSYRYDENNPIPAVQKVTMPKDLKGDAKEGRKLFMARSIGPCTGCHLIRGEEVWPAGNVGPDLQKIGDAGYTDDQLYQMIHDMRAINPNTAMPPWGAVGALNPQQIVHIVAFLKTEKGPLPPEKDPQRNPETRAKPTGFGDNLDPTNNPAMLVAEGAEKMWAEKGPKGKACADCHQGGVEKAMKGVATRYPTFVDKYNRIMAIEEFLQMHGPETTGVALPSQSKENLAMAILVKMQSNGMNVKLDLNRPQVQAALKRGEALFNMRVGKRNHACADCHTDEPGKGANKFLGGRLLADVAVGLTNHFPLHRTSSGAIWDIRKRYQWCMLPLGMNYLASDSVEYAELELYMTTFSQGKPIDVPGIRH